MTKAFIERTLVTLPYTVTEKALFGRHRVARPLQSVVQHLLRGPRPASFALDGHTFHCQTSHKYFFQRHNYERDCWAVLRQQIHPQDVVYDIGAHFGFWVIRLSGLCRHIVAFEPSPTNFRTLRQNAAAIPNVTLVNTAIGANEGTMAFSELGSESKVGVGDVTVAVTKLDACAGRYPTATLLLIDVEGFAAEVLRGGRDALRRGTPILCELHNAEERDGVLSRLSAMGYIVDTPVNSRGFPFRIFARMT